MTNLDFQNFEWIEDVREETNKAGYLIYRFDRKKIIYQAGHGYDRDPQHAIVYRSREAALKWARILSKVRCRYHSVVEKKTAVKSFFGQDCAK